MELPAEFSREPLLRHTAAQAISDAEMRRILRDAASEASRIVARYGDTFSSRVRSAQLDLARLQQQMWRTVGSQTRVGIGDGADAAAESLSFLNEVMMNSVGGSTTFWRQSLLAQARAGIPNLISRRENGISLSDRVYKNQALSTNRLNRMIDAMVINGASAREIATRARDFIRPDVPGGASYAAMRLGRTELNNAFHTTTKRLGDQQPWINGQKWNLSRSHPKPDICDELAGHDEGLGEGVYSKGNVPDKPHPQCFCFLTAVTPSREEFVQSFMNGDYDDYLDGVGCRGVA